MTKWAVEFSYLFSWKSFEDHLKAKNILHSPLFSWAANTCMPHMAHVAMLHSFLKGFFFIHYVKIGVIHQLFVQNFSHGLFRRLYNVGDKARMLQSEEGWIYVKIQRIPSRICLSVGSRPRYIVSISIASPISASYISDLQHAYFSRLNPTALLDLLALVSPMNA